MRTNLASTLTPATVWMTLAVLALASVPRIDCVCPNGQTKIFCLSSIFGRTGSCQVGTVRQQSSCGCCCRNNSATTCCEEPAEAAPSSDSPSVQRKGCVKTLVSPELAAADSTPDRPDDQVESQPLVASAASALAVDHRIDAESSLLAARPPSVDRVILLQQFRN